MFALSDTSFRSLLNKQQGTLPIVSKGYCNAPKARKSYLVAQQVQTAPPSANNGASAGGQPLIARQKPDLYAEQAYLTARARRIAKHFPTAIGVDDFLNRLEVALFAYGFTGDNSIGASFSSLSSLFLLSEGYLHQFPDKQSGNKHRESSHVKCCADCSHVQHVPR